MAQPKSPESAPNESESKKTSLDFKKIGAGALGLSLFLSAGATIEANMPMPNKNPNVNPPTAISYELPNDHVLNVGVSAGMRDVVPGEIGFKLPGIEAIAWIPGSEKTTVKQTLEQSPPTITTIESIIDNTYNQSMEWAEKFEIDPSAVEPCGPEAIKDAVERIKELEAQGYACEVSFEGSSSDESNVRNGDNPGFGINDEKNVKLGEKRAKAVAELFIQESKDVLGEEKANDIEKSMVILGGKEVRDDQLAKAIDEMADKLGMSMDNLVMQFNRGSETLPIEAQELLDGLRQYRFVRIEIKATKQSVVELPSDPEIVTTTTTEKEDNKEVKIVIIPILIPIFKRRTENVKVIPPSTSNPPSDPPKFPRQTGFTDRPGKQYNYTKNNLPDQKFNLYSNPKLKSYHDIINQPGTHNYSLGKGSGSKVGAWTNHNGNKKH